MGLSGARGGLRSRRDRFVWFAASVRGWGRLTQDTGRPGSRVAVWKAADGWTWGGAGVTRIGCHRGRR